MKLVVKKIAASLFIVGIFVVLLLPLSASAFTPTDTNSYYTKTSNVLDNAQTNAGVPKLATNIINFAMGLLGLVAVVIIIWAGFLWMTAGGNEDQLKKAKDKLIQGVIGLILIIASWGIASWLITAVAGFTNAT